MERKGFADMHCSIAQTLEVIGERWTPLIVRDAFFGVTRFDEFQQRLGIARNILQARLTHLVDHGVLVRTRYSEHPPRYDYRLTDKGRDLFPVLIAMIKWGDTYAAPDGPPVNFVHQACGHAAQADSVCSVCGGAFTAGTAVPEPGPGAVEPLVRAG